MQLAKSMVEEQHEFEAKERRHEEENEMLRHQNKTLREEIKRVNQKEVDETKVGSNLSNLIESQKSL
jgi:hypothetical protein